VLVTWGMQSSIIWFNSSHFTKTQVKFGYDIKMKKLWISALLFHVISYIEPLYEIWNENQYEF
jgi:hypothetical protein